MKIGVGQLIANIFFGILLLAPVLSMVLLKLLKLPIVFLLIIYVITILLGIIFLITHKRFIIPNFLWVLIPYFFYKFFVDFSFDESSIGSYYLAFRENIFIIAIFFGLAIIYNSQLSTKYANFIYKYLKLTIIIAPLISIVQVFNPLFLRIEFMEESSVSSYLFRRLSFFGFEDQNALGLTFLPLVFTFISIQFLKHRQKFFLLYLLLICIVLLLSNTRYVMFGLVFIFFQLILSYKNKLRTIFNYSLIFIVILIIFSYVYNFLGFNLSDFYSDRISDQGNINARVASFYTFLKFFAEYPLFGIGNEMAPAIVRDLRGASPFIHIGFLNHLVVYGLIGSLFLFSFWFGLLKKLYVNAKKTNYWAALFSFAFFLWANVSLVNYSIFFSGFLLALVMERFYTSKPIDKV